MPLLVRFGEGTYPSLGLATVAAMTGTRDVALRSENANTNTLALNGHRSALDGKSNLLVRYRGKKHTFRYVSAADVMQNRVVPGTFKDKLVMVGTTALGTREVVATPLDTLFVGVEVQATVADNLLQHDGLAGPSTASRSKRSWCWCWASSPRCWCAGSAPHGARPSPWRAPRRCGSGAGALLSSTALTCRRCTPRWASASRWP